MSKNFQGIEQLWFQQEFANLIEFVLYSQILEVLKNSRILLIDKAFKYK